MEKIKASYILERREYKKKFGVEGAASAPPAELWHRS
jgi:hypothetical protein